MVKGLIVSHKGDRCGVYQYGRNLFEILSNGNEIGWGYIECSNFDELKAEVDRAEPDAILFNHHSSTMPWLTASPLKELGAVLFGLVHPVTQEIADRAKADPFDFLIYLDPTLVPRNPENPARAALHYGSTSSRSVTAPSVHDRFLRLRHAGKGI